MAVCLSSNALMSTVLPWESTESGFLELVRLNRWTNKCRALAKFWRILKRIQNFLSSSCAHAWLQHDQQDHLEHPRIVSIRQRPQAKGHMVGLCGRLCVLCGWLCGSETSGQKPNRQVWLLAFHGQMSQRTVIVLAESWPVQDKLIYIYICI